MVKVVVTGISIQSCLGETKSTWDHIYHGISGLKIHQPFASFSPLPLGLISSQPTQLSKLTLQLIQALCVDAQINLPSANMGVVIGSSRGCQSKWEVFLSQLASDNCSEEKLFTPAWLKTLPHQPATISASFLGTSEVVLSPANACATGLVAIAQGYELIKQKKMFSSCGRSRRNSYYSVNHCWI